MVKIARLTKYNIYQVSAIADTAFRDSPEIPSEGFKASLSRKALLNYNIRHHTNVISLEYFVGLEESTKQVVGVIGLYALKEDQEDALWVGWFCVDPDSRGMGIGSALIDYVISETLRRKKRYLRLYTSTHPDETAAQTLYEHKGFRIVPERGRVMQKDYEIFYRELKLY